MRTLLKLARTNFIDNKINFIVFINKRSRIKTGPDGLPESLIVTTPEFRKILQETEFGKETLAGLENGQYKEGRKLGEIIIEKSPDKNDHFYYEKFYPFGHDEKIISIFRNKGIAATIEARLFKFILKIAKTKKIKFKYGLGLTQRRVYNLWDRGVLDPFPWQNLEEQQGILKSYLKQKSTERNSINKKPK